MLRPVCATFSTSSFFLSQTRLKFPLQVWPSKRSFTKAQWGQRWPLQANGTDRLPHTQSSESVDNSFFHLWGHMLTIKRQRPLNPWCGLKIWVLSLRNRGFISMGRHLLVRKVVMKVIKLVLVKLLRWTDASTPLHTNLLSHTTEKIKTNLRAHLYDQVWGFGLWVAVGIRI